MADRFRQHKSRDGFDWRVKQSVSTVYESLGDQALYAVKDIYYTGWEWVLRYSNINDGAGQQSFKQEITSKQTFKTGASQDLEWKVGFEFKGLGVSGGGSSREFSEEEVSRETKNTFEVLVPPHSAAYFYQKRYSFRTRIWFILDAWNQRSIVGHRGNYIPTEAVCESFIDTDEYHTCAKALTEETTFIPENTWQGQEPAYDVTRKYENCTERCKKRLGDAGLRG